LQTGPETFCRPRGRGDPALRPDNAAKLRGAQRRGAYQCVELTPVDLSAVPDDPGTGWTGVGQVDLDTLANIEHGLAFDQEAARRNIVDLHHEVAARRFGASQLKPKRAARASRFAAAKFAGLDICGNCHRHAYSGRPR